MLNSNNPTIITKRNTDSNENPISIKLLEKRQIMDNHSCVVLSQIPDESYRVNIEGFSEIFNQDEISVDTFYVSYNEGVIYFDPQYNGKVVSIEYYGIGYEVISASRVFYKYNKNCGIIETLEEILDSSQLQLELIEGLGNSVEIIEKLNVDVETARNLHEELADDISKISSTGNIEILVRSTEWTLNGDIYEKEVTHTLNSENLHVSAKNSDTKESITIGYKIVNKTKLLLKSDVNENASVVISASYYRPVVDSNVDEGEIVRARKGETGLDVKIGKIDAILESITDNNSLVIYSPNGGKYKITVSDNGVLSVIKV